ATETDYRPFGVRLTFKPLVLDDGVINLEIEPEVSELDPSINVNGNPAVTDAQLVQQWLIGIGLGNFDHPLKFDAVT
ncbi:hypothetical protein ACC734_40415, partial [Rhizobium ruizarguesonis]